ncbi:MAG TPA: ABC transporter permease [Acidobacteriaceae bacterium]|jgi:predicted permease
MFKRHRSADDFAHEIRSHLELEADELQQEGLSEEEARRRAKIEFGNVRAAEEHFYLKDRVEWFDNLVRDLKFAIRQMVKHPAFAATAILVLALGIGASVAIFAFVDAALLEPLPYANPNRLMSVNESSVEAPRWPLSYPDYLDWQRLNKSFRSLDVYGGAGYLLRTPSGAEPVQAERISGSFFKTLGIRPMLGRDFYPGEDQPGGPNLVLLSYGAWLARFGARHDVVGQTIDLDGTAYTIIGVLPRAFSFAPAGNAEFWVPLNTFSPHEKMRNFYNFWGIGRLRDGVTTQAALAEMTAIAKQLQRQYGVTGRDLTASVIPLSEVIVGDVRPILLTLLGGAVLLLLIACVNVASLVLVRAESRGREIAVRGALGATPARLVQQFVTEALLLTVCGSVAGVLVAGGLMHLLAHLVPKDMASSMPFLKGVSLNAHTAAFAAAIALMAALLLAATPILRLSFQKVRDGLTDGDRGSSGYLWRRLGANLVIVELAIAVVLLAGAGLLGQSLYRLLHVPVGFAPDHLATVEVMAPGTVYQSDEQLTGLYREIVRRVSSLPGVASAGMTSLLPVECNCAIDRIHFIGKPYHGEHNDVDERHVSAGYLPALNATLLRGHFFTDADDATRPGVAVINQALARKYFPNENPIGQQIADDEGGLPSVWEIVGVVDDIREGPLDAVTSPAEYFPLSQTRDHSFALAVRTRQDAATLLPLLVSTLHQIDANLGVSDEATMTAKIDATQAALLHRFSAWLVGGFAAIALVLGVVGLYGVIAYSVSQRTREIGVRMALGAPRSAVYSLILRQAGWLTAAGLAIGLVCSVGASLLIRNLLFGVAAWDAITLTCVAVSLGLASIAASFLPAHRAASVNPVEALRAE